MTRCYRCEKSRHTQCKKGSCDCKCRTHYDNIKARVDPDRLSNPDHDEYVEQILAQFRQAEK